MHHSQLILAAAAVLVVNFTPLAAAKPLQDTEALRIAFSVGGVVKVESFPFEKIATTDRLSVVHPDLGPNPTQTSSVWTGRFLKSFIKDTKQDWNPKSDLVLIGSDNYEAQLPVAVMMGHDVLLALTRDGEKLPWMKGGNYTIYPRDVKEPRYQRAGYWVWQVTAIAIGDLSAQLIVGNGKSPLDLTKVKGRTEVLNRRSIPVGIRDRDMPSAGQIKLGVISPRDLAVALGAPKASQLVFKTLNGWQFEVDPAKDAQQIIFAWDGATIPAAFGGPVQVCTTAPPLDCKFYVSSVEAK